MRNLTYQDSHIVIVITNTIVTCECKMHTNKANNPVFVKNFMSLDIY